MFGIPECHIKNIRERELLPYPIESLIEECGELITALAKHSGCRFDSWGQSKRDITGEMADVLVSMNLVADTLGISKGDIDNAIFCKAMRDGFMMDEYLFYKEKEAKDD